MIQENFNGSIDPDDVLKVNENPSIAKKDHQKEMEEKEDEISYDILPSNGPGLAGDDGEQVVDSGEVEEEEEEDE
jgi:hypothetical protein